MALRLVLNVFLGLAGLHVGLCAVTTTEPPKQLPDTSGIDFKLTDKLQVDKFFSLWMVFNNGEVQTSEEPFTIFAPRNNNASHHISNSLLAEPDLVKRLLLDHIVLGLKLNLNLSGDFTITTLGGRTVRVGKVNGSLYANKAKILEPWVEVPNGMLIVVDDYLFPEELIPSNKSTEAQKPPQTAESLVLITAEDDAPHETHNTSSPSNPFLRSVNQVLSYLRGGFKVFQRFLSNSSVPQYLKEDEEYTVFTPTDPAFHRWHPIDWGFYPFSVPEFTDETILNHFVRGNLRQDTITDGQKATTLGGREVVFKKILSAEVPVGGEGYPVGSFKLTVNGVPVFNGDTPVDHGNVMFIKDVLFVDDKVVQELQAKNRDKETAPLLAFPWVNSQFISHAFIQLQQDSRFTHLTRFFSLPDVAPLVTGNDYTFFVPTDDAFTALGLDAKPDGFLSKSEEQQILLNHIVPSRLYNRDLTDGKELRTLGGKTIHVNHYGDNVTVNDANVVQSEVFVYNLGVMYYIDRILFLTKDDLPETTEETGTSTETTTWLTESPEDVEKVPSELTEETGTLPDMLLDDDLEGTSRTENVNAVVQRIGEDLQDNITNTDISDAAVSSNEEATTEPASTEVPMKLNASIVSTSTVLPKRK